MLTANLSNYFNNDFLVGDSQNNLLEGLGGNDFLSGADGNDTLLGFDGADTIDGGGGNDFLNGEADDDLFIASLGNDTIDGSSGTDTADYGNSLQSITLLSAGVVKKSDGSQDTLISVETIVANAAKTNNLINASSATGSIFINADLTSQSLQVFNVPGASANPLTFNVRNFDDVIGSNQGDTIIGDAQNNIINGLGGNDVLNGGTGNDTLVGQAGNDTVAGGLGADIFAFSNPSEGIDLIIDFSSSQGDKIQISTIGFGTSSPSQFFYNFATGGLFFNGTQLATFQGNPTVNLSSDLVFV